MTGCTWRRLPRSTADRAAVLLLVAVIASRFSLEPLQSYYNKHHYDREYDDGHPLGEFEAIRVSQHNNLQKRGADLCSQIDLSVFAPGKVCGLPLSAPCFDSTRCSGALLSSLPRPLMYVYDNDCSLANSSLLGNATTYHADERDMSGAIWRTAAANAGLLAETYESACLFVHVNERVDHEPCASRAPLWNEGSNHVMVDLTDFSR